MLESVVIILIITVFVVSLYTMFRPATFTQNDLNRMMNKGLKKGHFIIR